MREQTAITFNMQDQDYEADLLRRISQADAEALEALYRVYYPRLLRFIYRVTHRLDQIEELINDVMLVVWQKAGTYDHTCRPSTWIFGIAYKKSLKALQQSQRSMHIGEYTLTWLQWRRFR